MSVHTEAALAPYKFLGATQGAVSTYEIPHGIPGYLWNCWTFLSHEIWSGGGVPFFETT